MHKEIIEDFHFERAWPKKKKILMNKTCKSAGYSPSKSPNIWQIEEILRGQKLLEVLGAYRFSFIKPNMRIMRQT